MEWADVYERERIKKKHMGRMQGFLATVSCALRYLSFDQENQCIAAESWYMGGHHRNIMTLRIGQDVTVSKSVYYHIWKKNIENQSGGVPFPEEVYRERERTEWYSNPKGETLNPDNMNIPVTTQRSFPYLLSNKKKILCDSLYFFIFV